MEIFITGEDHTTEVRQRAVLMHGPFLHLFAYGFVSMSIWGVRKWPKKAKKSKNTNRTKP